MVSWALDPPSHKEGLPSSNPSKNETAMSGVYPEQDLKAQGRCRGEQPKSMSPTGYPEPCPRLYLWYGGRGVQLINSQGRTKPHLNVCINWGRGTGGGSACLPGHTVRSTRGSPNLEKRAGARGSAASARSGSGCRRWTAQAGRGGGWEAIPPLSWGSSRQASSSQCPGREEALSRRGRGRGGEGAGAGSGGMGGGDTGGAMRALQLGDLLLLAASLPEHAQGLRRLVRGWRCTPGRRGPALPAPAPEDLQPPRGSSTGAAWPPQGPDNAPLRAVKGSGLPSVKLV